MRPCKESVAAMHERERVGLKGMQTQADHDQHQQQSDAQQGQGWQDGNSQGEFDVGGAGEERIGRSGRRDGHMAQQHDQAEDERPARVGVKDGCNPPEFQGCVTDGDQAKETADEVNELHAVARSEAPDNQGGVQQGNGQPQDAGNGRGGQQTPEEV